MKDDPEKILANPISAFLLIKHLTTELGLFKTVQDDIFVSFTRNLESISKIHSFPTGEDIEGAGLGLIRLMTTYNLETEPLSNGIINGKAYLPPLTADDCVLVARAMQANQGTGFALEWYKEANRRLNDTDLNPFGELKEIALLLEAAPLYIEEGRTVEAYSCCVKILELDPDNEEAKKMKKFYHKIDTNYVRRPFDEDDENVTFVGKFSLCFFLT